jgi:hypothetical protein
LEDFEKASKKNFLGRKRENKVSWIKWDEVCRSKSEGGLGVKDLQMVNLALFAKWRWRLLTDGPSLWKNLLSANVVRDPVIAQNSTLNFASMWYKDLCVIGKVRGSEGHRFGGIGGRYLEVEVGVAPSFVCVGRRIAC